MSEEVKIKVLFSMMIFISLSTLIVGSIYIDDARELNVFNYIQNNVSNSNIPFLIQSVLAINMDIPQCIINEPKENSIILRMDDVGTGRHVEEMKELVEIALQRDLSVSLAVIPNKLEEDRSLVTWLNSFKDDDRIEIVQHGFKHSENEFISLTKEESLESISRGRNIIFNQLNIVPITFIPPYNEYSYFTLEALQDLGFYINSAKEDEYLINEEFANIGYSARTFEFGNNEEFVPVSEVISDCKSGLKENNLCVIMIHPQDYLIDGEMNQEKYNEFIKMLDQLEQLNAEFITFKDLASCN